MEKIDLVYEMLSQSIENRREYQKEVNDRLEAIEKDIKDFKEFKGQLTGVCIAISTILGVIPMVINLLNK